MSLRISNILQAYDVYSVNKTNGTVKASQTVKKDAVALSVEAKDYQSIAKALRETPDIRANIVDDIKSRIDQGTYNVSSSQLADKLIENF